MKNPYIALIQMSWKYARRERKTMMLIYVMFIVANIISSLNPLLLGWFIGKAQNDTSKIGHFAMMYVVGYMLLKLAEWCFHGPARIMERNLAFNLSRNFLRERFHQTLHLNAKWHQDNHSGATISRISKAYGALREFFDKGFTYVYTLAKFVFSVSAIIYFSPLFGSIAVALGCLTVFIISKFDKPFIKTLREVNGMEHEVSSNLFDTVSNIRTVITLRLEKSMENGLMSKVNKVFRPFRKNAVINEWKWFVAEMMITMIYAVVVIGFIYQHWQSGQVFYIAGLVTLVGYVNQFTSVFQNVAGQYTGLVQYHTNITEAANITESFETQQRRSVQDNLPARWNSIEFNKINFSHRPLYDKQFSPQSLHNLYLHIERGSRIALIGESGSGKSTLLSLMRGLYNPADGVEYKIDGVKYPLEALHEWATLFPQEPEIFENTLEYNVTLGLPCSDDEIRHVCDMAYLTDVINNMPEGLQTDIREKGVNLSGGQKQRLALARGILAAKDSQVILMDEPTSSVDAKTEQQIYQNLFNAFENKAIVSSIHRLHLLDQFDYIYMLDKGRIIAEGTFEDMITYSEPFKNLWNHQKTQVVPIDAHQQPALIAL